MKLELKHLIYQNFKPLNVLFKDKSIDLIVSIDFEYGVVSFLNSNGNRLLKDNSFRLILRPLSDLTKEIEVNGEKFIPIFKIFEIEYKGTHHVENIRDMYFSESPTFLCSSHVGTASESSINMRNISLNNHWKIEQLLEWHFDVSGLIDTGLAVDINTVKF